MAFLTRFDRVRFRTEISLFFSFFVAKFLNKNWANRTLSVSNNKGICGLV